MRRLITFATAEYEQMAQRLTAGAAASKRFEVRIYRPADLPADFRQKHARHFEHRRGFGYWIWKPLFILQELEKMSEQDELMYCDSQCIVEADPAPLFDLARRHGGIGLFHQKRERHRNVTWTRGDCFALMGCDEPRYWNGDNLLTTYSVWTRSDRSIAFVREWLEWCLNYQVVSDEPSVRANPPEFKDHRHDQSIASLLAIKHNVFTLCDCSQWGDGYRCQECRYGRIINVDRHVTAPWLARPRMSSIIEVSAIGSCPMRCSYCPQDKLEASYTGPAAMRPELYERCLNNTVPGDAIYFAGFTEPCLHPQIMRMLQMTVERGHRTRLYTTGRGLNVEEARAIAQMPIEQIGLHLPDDKGHLRNSPATVPVLEALADHPGAFCMAMDGQSHAEASGIWSRLPRNYGAMHDRAGNLGQSEKIVQLQRLAHKGKIRCGAAPGLDHPVLLPDGRLVLCCMDYSLEHSIGNLAEQSLSAILRGPALEKIRAMQDGAEGKLLCRNCTCAVPAA